MIHYVYIDTNINRLLITTTQLYEERFFQLMSCDGVVSIALRNCKLFCIGYILGSSNKTPINDIHEFE